MTTITNTAYSLALSDELPLIISIPHSGREYPDDLIESSHLNTIELRTSEDAFVDHLIGPANELGASLLVAHYPRAYVDLNRSHEDLDASLFDGTTGLICKHSAVIRAGLGVIPRVVGKARPIYNRRLLASEAARRLEKAYYPYHAALTAEIERLHKKFGVVYLLDCHSMPSVPNRKPNKGGKARLPRLADIVLGDRWGTSCEGDFAALLDVEFTAAEFHTARNHPYAGGFITRHYGAPMKNIHTLQIEICRDLYMDEETITKSDDFEASKDKIQQVIKSAINYVRHKAGLSSHEDTHDLAAE